MSEDRGFYRKRLSSPGYLVDPNGKTHFQIKDLSLDGCQANFGFQPEFEVGDMFHLVLPELDVERNATVMWIKPDPVSGYDVGFFFGNLS